MGKSTIICRKYIAEVELKLEKARADLGYLNSFDAGLYEQVARAEGVNLYPAEWEKKLAGEVDKWSKRLEGIEKSGGKVKGQVPMLSQTPLVMALLGKDDAIAKAAKEGGLYASAHFFDKANHPNITDEMRKQIPEALARPLAVFDSVDGTGKLRKGEAVFLLDMMDKNGAPVIVPLVLEAKVRGKAGVSVGLAKTVYAKEAKGGGGQVVANEAWLKKNLKNNLRYLDAEKLKARWASLHSGPDWPLSGANAHGNKVRYFSDLVKAREDAKAKGRVLYQHEDKARIAKVTAIEPDLLRNEVGQKIDVGDTRAIKKWLVENLKGASVVIKDDGVIQTFTKNGLYGSLKGRKPIDREIYSVLKQVIRNSLFDEEIAADARHAGKVYGQRIYYGAVSLGGKHYAVKLRLDISRDKRVNPAYKGHTIKEIEIAPTLYKRPTSNEATPNQNAGAISGISLAVLKGDVNPSSLSDGILFQGGQNSAPYPIDAKILGAAFTDSQGRSLIRLFEFHNTSTILHEMAHAIRKQMEIIAKQPHSSSRIRERLKAIEDYYGIKDGNWTREKRKKLLPKVLRRSSMRASRRMLHWQAHLRALGSGWSTSISRLMR